MKQVRTQKKYRCDFCKRRSTKAAMERHERRCFRNPNRFCDNCNNKGFTRVHLAGDGVTEPAYYEDQKCYYCTLRDPKIEEGIAAYEASNKKELEPTPVDLPF